MLTCTWKGKRIIHLISTVHKPTEVFLDRRNKHGQIDNAPSLEVIYSAKKVKDHIFSEV